jgi:hypothetical protein
MVTAMIIFELKGFWSVCQDKRGGDMRLDATRNRHDGSYSFCVYFVHGNHVGEMLVCCAEQFVLQPSS